MKRGKNILLGLLMFLAVTGLASAANVFGEDVSLDTSPVLLMAQVIVSAIASIWAVKKVIGLSNKS